MRDEPTFIPYWSLATMGLLEMNMKSLFFTLCGRGMINETKTAISKTRRAKTCHSR